MPPLRFRTGSSGFRHPADRSDIQTQTGSPGNVDPDNLHTLALLM